MLSRRELDAMYREVKAEERAKREHSNAVRELAWFVANPQKPYTWRWWRMGFAWVYGERVDRHDFTVIPGYDTIAQEVASAFPEFGPRHAGDVGGTERLWQFLLSPYDPMPSKAEMMAAARRRLEALAEQEQEAFEYGANARELEFA